LEDKNMEELNINQLYTDEINNLNSEFSNYKYYINRELSWIDFNKRVLHQSIRKEVPLIERLKFLGITASNLDEFIMVRFSSIINKVLSEELNPEISGLLPPDEYNQVLKGIMSFKELQNECYKKLIKKLDNNNIHICRYAELNKNEKEYAEKLFIKNIYPLITPITIDTTKEFPPIKSKQLNIIVSLEDKHNTNLQVLSIIPIDNVLDRIYKIESEDDEFKYILLEDIIFTFLNKIFINKNILYKGCMRILREADIELDHDEDVYIIDRMKQTIIQREFSMPIFMDVDGKIPKNVLKLLIKIFNLDKKHVFKSDSLLDLSAFVKKPIKNSLFEYEQFTPQYPQELIGEHSMFTAIDSGDIILHHPYESFGPVIKFLEHSAEDKDVLAIKQTLYRVSSEDSPVVNALCKAAENGKQVSVLLEIKARFDEERNISLINKLKLSGCKLIYGVEELKTHCKFIIVVKKSHKGLKIYSHIGTGNYSEENAKVYTDLSYFTSNSKIGEDLITMFNILSGFSEPTNEINKLFFSPYNLRRHIYVLIDKEIDKAKKGKKAFISIKVNSISDKGIISKLYQASQEGVLINIFCRGICSMKPINKNIIIKSIVGRFLEHSRIYYFYNDGKSELLISSADLLTRNLDKRVELMIPITENEVKNKILSILSKYFKDSFNTYKMDKHGEYKLLEKELEFNIHEYFMAEAINNYKLRNIPKMTLKIKK
jgi:polyphosphate kinase